MAANEEPWHLRSTVPVLFPTHTALTLPPDDYDAFIQEEVTKPRHQEETSPPAAETEADDSFTLVSADQSTTADVRDALKNMGVEELSSELSTGETADPERDQNGEHQDNDADATPAHPFMRGLAEHGTTPEPPADMENKMFTENRDLAHRSTGSALVDLFASLERTISGPILLELLQASWAENPSLTLKVIFNARSIHLGKAEKGSFYRCAGWLAQHHPLTLITNLRWLSRPVIEKKVEKKEEGEGDTVLVEAVKDEEDVTRFDVKNGVSHGYWKDLLNIVALSANGLLTVVADPEPLFHTEKNVKGKKESNKEAAKAKRQEARRDRHQRAIERFASDPIHRLLHITVARLFAEQLRSDLTLLRHEDPKAKKHVSLCAKWAPSHDRFHDRHTFIVSSIAEILYPVVGEMDRELYLRNARESYRKDVSALRQHLDLVERNLSAKSFDKIKYERVPSVAMKNYAPTFDKKDKDRFDAYLTKVGEGKAQISGATLLPSTLVHAVNNPKRGDKLAVRVANAQWNTLVQRIKDSGTLESSIAVCDVSGSMGYPHFPDGTCPLDSSIGLSLLLAEVTAPPFGGAFITFSEKPQVQTFDVSLPLDKKIHTLESSKWGMSTDFVAVFEDLILPMAIRNKLKPEDMVKRIFVFSDMQFNEADSPQSRWTTSFERIQTKYADAGYAMPQMVFWNLAGGRAGFPGANSDLFPTGADPVVPKPVTVEDDGTALVSGYSQGMLKVFLDNGSFADPEREEQEDEAEKKKAGEEEEPEKAGDKTKKVHAAEEDEDTPDSPSKKRKIDPLSTVKKAVGHKAYDMLQVVD